MKRPLILLSPAKTLNFETPLSTPLAEATPTQPTMLERARELSAVAAALSLPELQGLMKLSDSLAELNYERFRAFDEQPARIAIGTFEGQAYKYIDAHTLSTSEVTYLQASLRILSGLYGLLRPLDEIRAYRLEMGTKLRVGETPSLYKYWGSDLTDSLNAEISASADVSFVLNVASKEYASAVQLGAGSRVRGRPHPCAASEAASRVREWLRATAALASMQPLARSALAGGETCNLSAARPKASLVAIAPRSAGGAAEACAAPPPRRRPQGARGHRLLPRARRAREDCEGIAHALLRERGRCGA